MVWGYEKMVLFSLQTVKQLIWHYIFQDVNQNKWRKLLETQSKGKHHSNNDAMLNFKLLNFVFLILIKITYYQFINL